MKKMDGKKMMKKIVSISLVGLFLMTTIAVLPASSMKTNESVLKLSTEENLLSTSFKELTLEDDAFHKTDDIFHIETWYFDAVFTNEYSMAVIVSVIQKGDIGSVLTGLYIYKDGDLIYRPRTFHTLKQLSFSEQRLDMKISDETIMTCNIDTRTGQWNYNVYENFDDVALELNFVNMTPGWRTDITGGWWLVNPRLDVEGWIMLEGEKISVSGEGYHDHNWFYTYTPLLQEGWHFGNIAGDSLGLTWANIMQDSDNYEVVGVINQKLKNPIRVDQNDMKITVNEYMWNNGKKIPKDYSIEIQNDRLKVNLNIETINSNHVKLPFLNYWRIHLRIKGTITVDSETENIDNIGISELMTFSRLNDQDSKPIGNGNLIKSSRNVLYNLLLKLIEKINSPILKQIISSHFF